MRRTLLPTLVVLVMLASCGSDSGTATPTPGDTTPTSQPPGSASPEFCDAYNSFAQAPTGLIIANDVGGVIGFFQDRAGAMLDVAPDEVTAALEEIIAYDATGVTDLAAAESALEQPLEVVRTFGTTNCPRQRVVEPTFTFDRGEGSGQSSVFFVTGECPDGSFPSDVSWTNPLARSETTALDLGGGSYSLAIPLQDGADPNSPAVLAETGIPDTVFGTC
ncbi:MAG: hypothetical protein MUE36_04995 [Acidimicrobiales bacterium]|jgi:hypothetical protein|nr:hypothetical protein [Acidimicrobiales bacterium]